MSNTKEGRWLEANVKIEASLSSISEARNAEARNNFYDHPFSRAALGLCFLSVVFLLSGCRQDMHDQPKYKPLRPSAFFTDGRGSRPLPDGTVARDQLREDAPFFTGKAGPSETGETTIANQGVAATPNPNASLAAQYQGFVTTFPFPIDEQALNRGEERYNIYCSVCHGRTGDGLGMIVRRGYRRPPSYHDDRLKQAPVGYFFDVITKGFGAMPDYSAQIPPDDRWKIIAYIRALQLSQQGTVADVPPDKRDKIIRAGEQQEGQKQGEHHQ